MTTVERVKAICKEKGIPISKLEKDLKFANGYIGQLKKGVLPDNRLYQISSYLGVSSFTLSGRDNDNDLQAFAYIKDNISEDEFRIHLDYLMALYMHHHPQDDFFRKEIMR